MGTVKRTAGGSGGAAQAAMMTITSDSASATLDPCRPQYHWPHALMSRKWIIVAAVALCVPAAWWLAQRMGSRIVTVTPPTEGDFPDARL